MGDNSQLDRPRYRSESDLLGEMQVAADALYGIATQRALANFPLSGRPVRRELVHAYGMVKLACLSTLHRLGHWSAEKFAAMEQACRELAAGELDAHVVVDALQGGAGTSTNMNVNEVLANRALMLLGQKPGRYDILDPHDDLNLAQSTNDTYPTALRLAAIGGLRSLEQKLIKLIDRFQEQERKWEGVVKLGRTQLQDAVPLTLGREFGAYAEAFARDRWRVYKCEERLRVVNLGGTAIGTGTGAPRQYILQVVDCLRELTGIGFARSENLVDATQNTDALVEVSGILKALANNLIKVANDLRLLSSGPHAGLAEISLPAVQPGSSIMPGKVNPVIPEAVVQCGMMVFANDAALGMACSSGNLELCQYLPLAADSLLSSIDVLTQACDVFAERCVAGIEANHERCRQSIATSTATLTALVPYLGYAQAEKIAQALEQANMSCRDYLVGQGLMTAEQFEQHTSPAAVLRLGSKHNESLRP